MATGALIGKFMPPHDGHLFLLDFAGHFVESLTLFISVEEGDPISGELRAYWASELFPYCRIDLVDLPLLEEASGEWSQAIEQRLGRTPDYLFSARRLGVDLASRLGSHLVTVEPPMASVELESRAIDANPAAHWERLPPMIRPHYLKRVCVFGPESTGKSTLCQRLAQHFRTVAVPEYSRLYLEHKQGRYQLEDVIPVARGQRALEETFARRAGKVLFCDTDMLTTKIWSDWLFGQTDPWIEKAIAGERHHLYLLTSADVPWVEDPVRYLPNDRHNFEERCEQELRRYGRRFVRISGDWEKRFETAVKAVEELLRE